LLLTDYSSVAFEMGLLGKSTIYYQFDHDEFFGGNHSYEKGYFEYKKDGFGPICYKEHEVIDKLSEFIQNEGKPSNKYTRRMKDFFKFHDTNNSKRVFEAIIDLNRPRQIDNNKDINLYISEAVINKKWKRIESLLSNNENLTEENLKLLIEAKVNLGKIEVAKDIYKEHNIVTIDKKIEEKIFYLEELFNLLSEDEKKLLVSDDTDLFFTLKFKNIEKLFNHKKWNVLYVAFELYNEEDIPEDKESKFYYMWGRTLRLVNQKERALEILAKSLSYNQMEPNSAIWEYASTLYEVYDEDEINKELIQKVFIENNYSVENITYKLIEGWFEKKHYKQVSVAFELYNEEDILEDKESKFYYMWGKILFSLGSYKYCIEKFEKSSKNNLEVKVFKAKAMTYVEDWDDAYGLWREIYNKYPKYDRKEVLKNMILALKYLDKEDEFEKYKNKFLQWKFLNTTESDIEILNTISEVKKSE
jgi:tetratricopeptide (TPR) repeat protein